MNPFSGEPGDPHFFSLVLSEDLGINTDESPRRQFSEATHTFWCLGLMLNFLEELEMAVRNPDVAGTADAQLPWTSNSDEPN